MSCGVDILHRIKEFIIKGETLCLATVIASSDTKIPLGHKVIIHPDGSAELASGPIEINRLISALAMEVFAEKRKKIIEIKKGVQVFFDLLSQTPYLVVCGAGHIAVPLARFALDLGFAVTVVDNRSDFAHEERFPGCSVIAEDFVPALRSLEMGSSAYAVVITRGHEHDAECLAEILKKETAYVGLIGSRRRVNFVLEMLARGGIPQKRLAEVFTPIGLPIGAESPVEIALSIITEIVCVRRKGGTQAQKIRNSVR